MARAVWTAAIATKASKPQGVVQKQPDGGEENGHACAAIRCTVPAPTPNCFAILVQTRMPGQSARPSLICQDSAFLVSRRRV
jgi:hypothetical protein